MPAGHSGRRIDLSCPLSPRDTGLRGQRREGTGMPGNPCWRTADWLSPRVHAILAARSGPGSARTMRSLAASSFRVEGGETYDRFGDQPSPNRFGDQPSPNRFGDQPSPRGGGDHRRRAACAATRPHPWCALPVLPDREVRVLAAGQPAAPGRLSRLPAVDADALHAAGIATAGVTGGARRGLLRCHWSRTAHRPTGNPLRTWLCRIASGTVIAAQGALRARGPG